MNEPEIATLTVTELMGFFRAGLRSILPVMERAGLPWTDDGTSDPWDDVQESLYRAIIDSCLEHIVGESSPVSRLAGYGFWVDSYDSHSFLSARSLRVAGIPNAFLKLTNGAAPFGAAEFRELGADLTPTDTLHRLVDVDFEIGLRSVSSMSYRDALRFYR